MTPRNKVLLAIPLVAVFVIVLAYYRLFTNPAIIALIFILYVAVSLRNRRKFGKQPEGQPRKRDSGAGSAKGGKPVVGSDEVELPLPFFEVGTDPS